MKVKNKATIKTTVFKNRVANSTLTKLLTQELENYETNISYISYIFPVPDYLF